MNRLSANHHSFHSENDLGYSLAFEDNSQLQGLPIVGAEQKPEENRPQLKSTFLERIKQIIRLFRKENKKKTIQNTVQEQFEEWKKKYQSQLKGVAEVFFVVDINAPPFHFAIENSFILSNTWHLVKDYEYVLNEMKQLVISRLNAEKLKSRRYSLHLKQALLDRDEQGIDFYICDKHIEKERKKIFSDYQNYRQHYPLEDKDRLLSFQEAKQFLQFSLLWKHI